jgi:hypothetical protein
MSFLIFANVPLDGAQEAAAAGSNARPHGSRLVFVDDIRRLLEALTVERMEIVAMLLEEGPMRAESIASLLARERTMVMHDLETLLDLEIIDLDHDASYLFGFNGMRVVLQYPIAE